MFKVTTEDGKYGDGDQKILVDGVGITHEKIFEIVGLMQINEKRHPSWDDRFERGVLKALDV